MKIHLVLLACLQYAVSNGQVLYGTNNYVEFHIGDVNVLLTVPHDGALEPNTITTRTSDSAGNLLRDLRTRTITETVRNELIAKFGGRPYMLINNLHRKKMDPNRPPLECCHNKSEPSYVAYTEYHNFINKYVQFIKNGQKFGGTYAILYFKQALLFDIHGQAHDHNLNELGYDITKSKLNSGSFVREDSTICSLAKQSSPNSFTSILRGSVSLGKYLADAASPIGSLPSPANPSPGLTKDYYDGGYTVVTYGSKNCVGNINAIQLELSATFRANDSGLTDRAKNLAKAILDFYSVHKLYNRNIKILWPWFLSKTL